MWRRVAPYTVLCSARSVALHHTQQRGGLPHQCCSSRFWELPVFPLVMYAHGSSDMERYIWCSRPRLLFFELRFLCVQGLSAMWACGRQGPKGLTRRDRVHVLHCAAFLAPTTCAAFSVRLLQLMTEVNETNIAAARKGGFSSADLHDAAKAADF